MQIDGTVRSAPSSKPPTRLRQVKQRRGVTSLPPVVSVGRRAAGGRSTGGAVSGAVRWLARSAGGRSRRGVVVQFLRLVQEFKRV